MLHLSLIHISTGNIKSRAGKKVKIMPYIAPEVVQEVKRMDLLTYLRNYEPSELVHFSGNTYTTRTHDSLKISNGRWMWWSQGIGGRSALDLSLIHICQKLKEAILAAEGNEVYRSNVEALKKVQPKDLTASEIGVRLGATWIPPKDIEDFVFELLETPNYSRDVYKRQQPRCVSQMIMGKVWWGKWSQLSPVY